MNVGHIEVQIVALEDRAVCRYILTGNKQK
jgi:hypothetical protein